MSDKVKIVEVGPRDGLQNEPGVITVVDKVRLIHALSDAGLREIEVGSYVSPKWVPQMADTDQVLSELDLAEGIKRTVLVPNKRGFEALMAAPVKPDEIAVFVSVTEGFSQANLNCSVAESLDRLTPVVEAAQREGLGVRGYLSCVIECPFDGKVDPARVASVAADLCRIAPMELSLGDTIGAGIPETVRQMWEAVFDVCSPNSLAGHFHDTGGRACENIEASIDMGVRVFDSAVGGLGGCPYAPGAPGNVATEAVVDLLNRRGFECGVDRAKLAEAVKIARQMKGQTA